MTDLSCEWEKHSGDRMSREELDAAYRKVRRTADRPARRRRAVSVAASLAICLLLVPAASIALYRISSAPAQAPQMCEVSTHDGETRSLTLPDGSQVTLNAGSVLIYPERFDGDVRRVHLSGEAVFDVTPDTRREFAVGTMDFVIRVHGTTFNVNSYPDSRTSSATLCEGSITAEMNATGKQVGMVPGQCLTFNRDDGSYALGGVDTRESVAWLDGDICFSSESIHGIVKSIERGFGVNVYITSGKYDDACITAKFLHGETLDEVMSAVCRLVPGMKYTIVNSNVYIR